MSDQNSETILKDPCAELLRLANICVQIDPQACVTCFDPVTFQTALLQETTREFQKAMGFAVPSDPTFCDVAKQKVCDNYIATQSCCCQEETAAYRQCLFNEVLVPSVGLSSAQCSDTCSQKEGGEGSSSGGSTEAIIGIIVALVILVGIFCSVYIYRRRNRVGDLPTTRTSDKKKSFLASFGSNTPKRRASEKKVDEETPEPPSSSSDDSSSSSSDSSSSSSSSEDSSASSSDDSAAFRPKQIKPISAEWPAARIQSFGGESSISSRDLRPKQVPSLNEDALNKTKEPGSQRSVPSFISTDSSLEGSQQPKRKAAKEQRTTSDREIFGSLNADKMQSGSQQKSFKSYVSNDESKSGRRSSERKSQEAAARSSDDSGREEIVKELTSKMHDFEAQAFALKLENSSASKKLNELEKDRTETDLRLSQLEKAKTRYEKRVRYAEAKADALHKTQESDAKIIAELQVRNDALSREVKLVRSMSEELPLDEGESNSSLSKDDKAPKSRLPKSGGHKLENLAGNFNGSWTPERAQAFEKWELKIKRAPGLC